MPDRRIRIRKHETVPNCGSFEVRYPEGKASKFFYWDDIPGRRLRPDQLTRAEAFEAAQAFARAERDNAG